MATRQSRWRDKDWCFKRASPPLPFTDKDDVVREGKRLSPRQAMEAAAAAVAAGEASGVYLIRTGPDPERQAAMLALNVGGH